MAIQEKEGSGKVLLKDKHADYIASFEKVDTHFLKSVLPPNTVHIASKKGKHSSSKFILQYGPDVLLKFCHAWQNKESFEFHATEHFRMSGVYWGLTAMHLLGRLDVMDKDTILAWVLSCQREDGGFGGSERHDSHLLYTLSAVQILALYGALDRVNTDRILSCESRTCVRAPMNYFRHGFFCA